jgi:NADH-quinone oxidoreductase subunit J
LDRARELASPVSNRIGSEAKPVAPAFFLIISAVGLLAALGTVLARNLVHAGLYLVAFFFIIACQFVFLEAEFLAAIQVLIYIGAVAILLMFGIMLTRNVQGDDTTILPWRARIPAVIAGLALFVLLSYGISEHTGLRGRRSWYLMAVRPAAVGAANQPLSPRAAVINNMGAAVGKELMTRFVVPFEVAGLLLTAAMVGAIALAHREGDEQTPRVGALATVAQDGSAPGPASLGAARSEALSTPSS